MCFSLNLKLLLPLDLGKFPTQVYLEFEDDEIYQTYETCGTLKNA